MLFPISKLWSRPVNEDTVGKIDRCLADRTHRLNAGICLSQDFKRIDGCLIVVSGRGKYLRIRQSFYGQQSVPANVADSLREACSENGSIAQLKPILLDLAESQAAMVDQLKAHAGKAVDRILTVSVRDPGFWATDFDQQPVYFGLCDSSRLAELTGITVVDNFPARELTVGGNGQQLECLPYWLAFADRSPKVSTQTRLVIDFGLDTVAYVLPPSDGLDAEVPRIQALSTVGLALPLGLLESKMPTQEMSEIERWTELSRLYVSGQSLPSLLERWNTTGNLESTTRQSSWLNDALQMIGSDLSQLSAAIHTAFEVIGSELAPIIKQPQPIDRLMTSMPSQLQGCLINLLDDVVPDVPVESHQSGVEGTGLGCLTAAILGLMHIDQLPANIPWITGADHQRILGSLTPGRPANWRQLVLDMADYCPPAMKLRDAV